MEPVGMTNACANVVVPKRSSRIVAAHSAMLFRFSPISGVRLGGFLVGGMDCPIIAGLEKLPDSELLQVRHQHVGLCRGEVLAAGQTRRDADRSKSVRLRS